jgi:hypothetical protein
MSAWPCFFPASPDLHDAKGLPAPDKFDWDAGFASSHAGCIKHVCYRFYGLTDEFFFDHGSFLMRMLIYGHFLTLVS